MVTTLPVLCDHEPRTIARPAPGCSPEARKLVWLLALVDVEAVVPGFDGLAYLVAHGAPWESEEALQAALHQLRVLEGMAR